MNRYESVVILKPTLTEEEKTKELNDYKELFESFSNKPVTVEDMGKKKLAYEIRKQSEGFYAVFNFKSEPENIAEVERKYRIDDNVIKFLNIRLEPELENDESLEDEDLEM